MRAPIPLVLLLSLAAAACGPAVDLTQNLEVTEIVSGWQDAGIVDLRALFSTLRTIGYDRWASVEDFTTEQPLAERVKGNAAFLRAALTP